MLPPFLFNSCFGFNQNQIFNLDQNYEKYNQNKMHIFENIVLIL
jgi:hypothetical protein